MDAAMHALRAAAFEDPDAAAAAGMDEALHAERIRIWKMQADQWLAERPQGALFTADDLVAAIGKPDTQGRNNAVGAWINAQRNRRRIEFTGRVSKSARVEGHGNMQRLWRVKDGRVEGDAGSFGPPRRSADVSLSLNVPVLDEAPAGFIGVFGDLPPEAHS